MTTLMELTFWLERQTMKTHKSKTNEILISDKHEEYKKAQTGHVIQF